MKSIRQKASFFILATGVTLVIVAAIVANWFKWEPVSFQVDLRIGQTESPLFRINYSANYLIELELERTLPFERLNCLLGVDPGLPDKCKETDSPVDLTWSIRSSDKVIAEGSSEKEHGGAWSDTIDRTIGTFEGKKGGEYRLIIRSLKDASVLAPTKPRIVVRVHPFESKGYVVIAQAILWLGMLVGISGVILLVLSYLRRGSSADARG